MNVIFCLFCSMTLSFPFWSKPAAPPTRPVKVLTARSDKKTTIIAKGDKFKIRLTHQPGDGYALKVLDNANFKLEKYSTEPRKGRIFGKVEVVIYEFKAIKPGHTTLTINAMAPGKDKPERVYNYKFVVKPE